MENKVILLISPEPWGTNFVSKHHYANYLSNNHTVYFLNPPKGFSKNPLKGINAEIKQIKQGLFTIDYLNLIPRLNTFPKWIQNIVYKKQALQIQKKIGIKKLDIVWNFDPYRFFDQSVWEVEKKIYHSVDIHSPKAHEKELCFSSDITLLSSDYLRVNLPKLQNIHRIGHGTDTSNSAQYPNPIEGNNETKAILTGNFTHYIDFDLIRELSNRLPMIDFIFVGPNQSSNLGPIENEHVQKIATLNKRPNVYFIGPVDASQLNSLIAKAAINLILYRQDLKVINPHKLLGYFYSGNVIISSFIDDYEDFDADLLLMTKDNSKIPDLVEQVYQNLNFYNSKELVEKRQSFAKNNSYSMKIDEIMTILYQ